MPSKSPWIPQAIEQWVRSLRTSSTEHRRKIYFAAGSAVVAVALLGVCVVDLMKGQLESAIRCFSIALTLLVIAALVPKRSDYSGLGRVTLILTLAMVSYETAAGVDEGFTFLWLYVLPLGLFFVLGRREGIIWLLVIASILGWLLFAVDHRLSSDDDVGTIAVASFLLLGILGYGLETARNRLSELLRAEKAMLEKSLADLKALYGLLPICASCKSVRDDDGYWHDIESYLSEHSAVELTAAVCPNCMPGFQATVVGDRGETPLNEWSPSLEDRSLARDAEHHRRRRIYFSVGLGVLIPSVGYFASLDIQAERWFEAGLVSGLGLLFTAALWILQTGRAVDRFVYQVVCGASLSLMAYKLHAGDSSGYVALWLFSLPAFAIFALGRRGLVWSLGAFGVAAVYMLTPIGYAYAPAMSGRFLTIYALVTIMAFGLEAARRHGHDRLAQESNTLRETLDEVCALRGLLPMCPSCKKVRDDEGFWEQIEIHVGRISGARFTHGICPPCSSAALLDLDLGAGAS